MNPFELYQQIAEAYHVQGKYQERDRFLVLALDAAQNAGQPNMAEQVRQRLLELNPNHLIKPYSSCAAALQAPNFTAYVGQLRKNFPGAKAQALLKELGGPVPAKPKRTQLADANYPTATPAEDPKTPTWSQINVASRPKQGAGPSIGILNVVDEPRTVPSNDPLANVPVSPQQPVPFKLQEPLTQPQRKPEIIPAPRRELPVESESPAGVWIGNFLFLVLFLAGIATLAYIFVLPFYPEVAKMLKPGS